MTSSSDFPTGPFVLILGVLYLVLLVVSVWAYVRIIRRSGYSGWWVLIGLVPILNVIMFFVFAFRTSPTERELAQLRSMVYRGAPGR